MGYDNNILLQTCNVFVYYAIQTTRKKEYNMTQLLTITQDNRDIFHGYHKAAIDLLKVLGLSGLYNSTVTKLVVEIKNEGVFATISSLKDGEPSEEVFLLKSGNGNAIQRTLDILGLSLLRGICNVKLTVEAGCLASLVLEIEPGVCCDYVEPPYTIKAIPLDMP